MVVWWFGMVMDEYMVLKVYYVVGDFFGTFDLGSPYDMVVDIVDHEVLAFVDILAVDVVVLDEQVLAFFHCGSVVNVLGDMYTRVWKIVKFKKFVVVVSVHSSKIRSLCLMKWSSEMFQNLFFFIFFPIMSTAYGKFLLVNSLLSI